MVLYSNGLSIMWETENNFFILMASNHHMLKSSMGYPRALYWSPTVHHTSPIADIARRYGLNIHFETSSSTGDPNRSLKKPSKHVFQRSDRGCCSINVNWMMANSFLLFSTPHFEKLLTPQYISIGATDVPTSLSARILKVAFDEHMNLESHVKNEWCSCFQNKWISDIQGTQIYHSWCSQTACPRVRDIHIGQEKFSMACHHPWSTSCRWFNMQLQELSHIPVNLIRSRLFCSSSSKSLLYVTFRHKRSFKWHCNTIKTLWSIDEMKWCTDDDVRVGVIGHGGLLRAFSFARPETWVSLCNLMLKLRGISRSSAILGSDSPQSNNRKDNSLWVTPFTPVLKELHWLPVHKQIIFKLLVLTYTPLSLHTRYCTSISVISTTQPSRTQHSASQALFTIDRTMLDT